MKKQVKVCLYAIMIISLIACGFIGIQRIQVESQYKEIEIAVKYSDILKIAEEEEKTLEEVLEDYKQLGVTTILAKELTVASVDQDYSSYKSLGEITLVEGYILKFTYPEVEEIKPESRYIVTENQTVKERILENYKLKGIELDSYENDGVYFMDLGDYGSALTAIGVGFDEEGLNAAADMGYNISLQLKSWDEPTDEAIMAVMQQIKSINNVETLYFSDSKITMANHPLFVENVKDYQLGFIEFTSNRQEGFSTLAKKTSEQGKDYKVVRLHTIEDQLLTTTSVSQLIERYDLALKERNNRVFLFKLPVGENVKHDINYLNEGIERFVKEATKAGFKITNHVDNYNLKAIPTYLAILVSLGAIIAFVLLMDLAGFTKLGYVFGILGTLGYLGLLKINVTLASQLMALFGSIIFPTYAFATCLVEEGKSIKECILTLIKICAISFGGVLTIIGCLSRTNFALAINMFLGVKIATVLPIILVLIYLVFKKHRFDFRYYKSLLDKKISYGSLIIVAFLAVVFYIYVTRSGNSGTSGPIERAFRQFLDNVLGVRPRTKEFLIAYPILMALLYYGYKEKYLVAVILAVIGPVSLVNTYGHIHTPIVISLIRSAYGIIFGVIIGLVLIGCINLLGKGIRKCQKQLK